MPAMRALALFFSVLCASAARSGKNDDGPRYDYVVVGGGTAGLVVANRLSEDSGVSVAVIEAGGEVLFNPNVTNTTTFGLSLDTGVDWSYESVAQRYAGNGTGRQKYHAGRALGGTSVLNGMTYLRAEAAQIDAWQALGNSNWTWSSLYPYYKKSERFDAPAASQTRNGAAFDPALHGFAGPLHVGWQSAALTGDAAANDSDAAIVNATWNALGVPYRRDANGGRMRGFSVWPFTVDAREDVREDAARAYFYPVSGRRNLHVYLNTTATRLVWEDKEEEGGLVARGVEVVDGNNDTSVVLAGKEVILSLGALRTPALLEHSGVGNPDILSNFSIPVRIPLPAVGENLQDQTNTALTASLTSNSSFLGYPPYVTYLTLTDLFGTGTNLSTLASTLRSAIPSYAALNVIANSNRTNLTAQEKLLNLQADLILDNPDTVPVAEILTAPYGALGLVLLPVWATLPFARGSVHIASRNPLDPPAINPNFFLNPLDTQIQIGAARVARRAFSTPPLSARVGAELAPGLGSVPPDAGDGAWSAWLEAAYGSNAHALGTAAMMARGLGGVVDDELRVYGTGNVRVVDAGVLPWQVSGHLSATVYAVAERAGDVVRGLV